MNLKRSPTPHIVRLVAIIAAMIFAQALFMAIVRIPDSEVSIPFADASGQREDLDFLVANNLPPTVEIGIPDRLLIPSLNIDAKVRQVGITNKGTMATPKSFKEVGWYKYGKSPGQLGNAVLAGHVDNALGLAGVFKNLEDIQIGEEIKVFSQSVQELTFEVEELEWYNYKNVPTEKIFNQKDARRIVLVTCGGKWIQTDKTYEQRLVVYAVLKK